jgi:hypothetical protein
MYVYTYGCIIRTYVCMCVRESECVFQDTLRSTSNASRLFLSDISNGYSALLPTLSRHRGRVDEARDWHFIFSNVSALACVLYKKCTTESTFQNIFCFAWRSSSEIRFLGAKSILCVEKIKVCI